MKSSPRFSKLGYWSKLAAAGASGVPSGSLLLVPLSCSLFGISYDVAMQVVAVGFIISVVQDSAALGSASPRPARRSA